jgi:hypothetical protein
VCRTEELLTVQDAFTSDYVLQIKKEAEGIPPASSHLVGLLGNLTR